MKALKIFLYILFSIIFLGPTSSIFNGKFNLFGFPWVYFERADFLSNDHSSFRLAFIPINLILDLVLLILVIWLIKRFIK